MDQNPENKRMNSLPHDTSSLTETLREVPEALGIIAGKGAYPIELAKSARAQGVKRIFAVAFKGETRKELAGLVDEIRWHYVGQLTPFLDTFEASGVSYAVMAGQISPKNLFHVRLDKDMRAFLKSLPQRNADTIFSGLGELLQERGVTLIAASQFMEASMPQAGVVSQGRDATEQELRDMALGFDIAKQCGGLKIGQTVVIKNGTVLAVEAFEGTDAAIRRAGKLGGKGGVVVKVSQPGHDMRFDIPVIGTRTLKSIRKAGVTALAVEAGRTIFLEREAVIAEAKRMDLYIEARDAETCV